MARTSPCKLDLFECFKIIWNAMKYHHPLSYRTLLVPTIPDMNIVLFGHACTFLSHGLNGVSWDVMFSSLWDFEKRIQQPQTRYICLTLACRFYLENKLDHPMNNSLKMQRYMFTFLWQLCKYLTTFRWSFRKTWNFLVSGAIRKCNYMFYGTYPLKR